MLDSFMAFKHSLTMCLYNLHTRTPTLDNWFVTCSGSCLFHLYTCEQRVNMIPEVVHVGNLLHTQPAELTGTHSAVHSVTAAVVGLHYVGATTGARFDLFCVCNRANAEY